VDGSVSCPVTDVVGLTVGVAADKLSRGQCHFEIKRLDEPSETVRRALSFIPTPGRARPFPLDQRSLFSCHPGRSLLLCQMWQVCRLILLATRS
jgi:hypothetical protein